jgi:hypothetical protein
MHIFIESEGDIQLGVKHCSELAKMRGKKFITLVFPSELLYKVFMNDLVLEFEQDNNLPGNVDIEANIILPFEEGNNG